MNRNNVVIFEGPDYVGKTTMVDLVSGELTKRGVEHVVFREPGTTVLGKHLRDLLLHNPEMMEDSCPMASAMLFFAARAQLIHEKIKPALADGKIVLLDRFDLSTVAYQTGELLETLQRQEFIDVDASQKIVADFGEKLRTINNLVTGGLSRRYVVLTAADDVLEWRRRNTTYKDHMENRSNEFIKHVSSIYKQFIESNEGDKRVLHVHDDGKVYSIAERVERVCDYILYQRNPAH